MFYKQAISQLRGVRHYSKAVQLSFQKYGDNGNVGPIVICHGLFGSKQNWKSLAKALEQKTGRDIYAVDLRNHGDSPQVKEHNYGVMSQDLAHFISHHNLSESILVGHSMGGKVVMKTALESSEIVSKLVVIDMPPVSLKLGRSFRKYIQAMKEIEESQVTKQSEANTILAKYEPDQGIRMFLLTNLKRSSDGIQRFRVPYQILGDSLENIGDFSAMGQYDRPTLFIAGGNSPYSTPFLEQKEEIEKLFPNSSLEIVEKTGHWVHAEKPDAVLKLITKFAKEQ
ncbi:Alpha/Beta hydrolase protein [Sporodiniella umbellata]|nr:Alpha/Beta hydrolase protein [Sporodiniella umbellata]